MTDTRDDPQLSALLRATVDAPPLRPDFHDQIEARLTAADAAGRGARVTGIPARRRNRLTTRRLLAAAAVAAAAAVFAFAVLPALRGTDSATAGDVLAAMTASSGGAQTVRMHAVTKTVVSKGKGAGVSDRSTDTADVTMNIRGDSLADLTSAWAWKNDDGTWTSHTSSSTTSYDETLHEARSIPGAGSAGHTTTIRRPAWSTDSAAIGSFTELYADIAAQMHAALAETDPSMPVHETTHLGRPAWQCVFTTHERWGMDNELPMAFHWDATVDKATGLLVAVSFTIDAKGERQPVTWDMRVTSLQLDPALQPGWQRPAASGPKLKIIDDGTRFGTPEEVAKLSWPTLPLIPQWAPAGYRLTDVASPGAGSARMRRRGSVLIKRAKEPPGSSTVLVRYRRGFGSFTVQISPKQLGETVSGKPDVILSAGYLKGQPAVFADDAADGTQIGISPPTLIAYSVRSKVVITGDLTRDELVKVANSMKVYGDESRPIMPGFKQN
jgi:hypothetical protein